MEEPRMVRKIVLLSVFVSLGTVDAAQQTSARDRVKEARESSVAYLNEAAQALQKAQKNLTYFEGVRDHAQATAARIVKMFRELGFRFKIVETRAKEGEVCKVVALQQPEPKEKAAFSKAQKILQQAADSVNKFQSACAEMAQRVKSAEAQRDEALKYAQEAVALDRTDFLKMGRFRLVKEEQYKLKKIR